MSSRTELGPASGGGLSHDLQRFGTMPQWLSAMVDPDRVRRELTQSIPEFASGALTLVNCDVERARMKKGNWSAIYRLTVAARDGGESRRLVLRGTLIPPTRDEQPTPDPAPQPLGTDGWRFHVAALRLRLEPQPPDAALPALPVLTDPERARALLEQSIRGSAQEYRDLRLQASEPKVMRYKPGSRCTILYRLTYAPEHADRGWPDVVVAKTYHGDKGCIAYAGMRGLWDSAPRLRDAVTLAEPLAFLSEMNVLVQGPVREEQTLQDLIRATLHSERAGSPAELDDYMRKTARGLVELHRSEVRVGEHRCFEDEFSEVRADVDRLAAAVPELEGAAAPLLTRLQALSGEYPAGPLVPTHGTFRPAQVLLHQGRIGFIDFDGFCQSEPALDVALFLGKILDIGLNTSESGARPVAAPSLREPTSGALLEQTESICETFLSEYERHLPISRQRVALWGSLNLLTMVLHGWTKVKPERLEVALPLLTRYLKSNGI